MTLLVLGTALDMALDTALLVLGTALGTALERPDAGYLVGSLDEGALRTVLSSAPLDRWTGEDPWLVAWKAPPPRAHRARIPNAANVRYCTRVIFIIVVPSCLLDGNWNNEYLSSYRVFSFRNYIFRFRICAVTFNVNFDVWLWVAPHSRCNTAAHLHAPTGAAG
jgi:hypothetical protein